jgi:hypothetical protein
MSDHPFEGYADLGRLSTGLSQILIAIVPFKQDVLPNDLHPIGCTGALARAHQSLHVD